MATFNWVGPDQAPVFESASTDDKLWIVPASLDQVRSFIQDPRKWIAELNAKLPSGSKDKVVVTDDFALRLKIRPSMGTLAAEGKECLIQGIAHTNVVTIRPRLAIVQQAPASWDDYWKAWSTDGDNGTALNVTISKDSNQGYGHIELTSEDDAADVRADKIAAFLMWGADPKKTYQVSPGSPAIPFLNKVLLKIPASITVIDNQTVTHPNPTQRAFQQVAEADFDRITFTLVSRQSDFPILEPLALDPGGDEDEDDPVPPALACDNMNGAMVEQYVLVDDVLVKNYVQTP